MDKVGIVEVTEVKEVAKAVTTIEDLDTLDPLDIMTSLQDAIKIIGEKARSVANGSIEVWKKLDHARDYLNKEMKVLLAPPKEKI